MHRRGWREGETARGGRAAGSRPPLGEAPIGGEPNEGGRAPADAVGTTEGWAGNLAAAQRLVGRERPSEDEVLIVTGSTLDAEREDRAAAYALRAAVESAGRGARALVCGDLWYLSQDSLRSRATISVGPPERNALSAFLITRLPRVYSAGERVAIHLDLHQVEAVACCWGAGDGAATRDACGVFVARFLKEWMGM